MERMKKAVIGRRKIDSYVLHFCYTRHIPTVDISHGSIALVYSLFYGFVVVGIHQGIDTYEDHLKQLKKENSNDFFYNSQFYNDRFQKQASLRNCVYSFGMCVFFSQLCLVLVNGKIEVRKCVKKTKLNVCSNITF